MIWVVTAVMAVVAVAEWAAPRPELGTEQEARVDLGAADEAGLLVVIGKVAAVDMGCLVIKVDIKEVAAFMVVAQVQISGRPLVATGKAHSEGTGNRAAKAQEETAVDGRPLLVVIGKAAAADMGNRVARVGGKVVVKAHR